MTKHNNPHHAINRAVYAKAMANEQTGIPIKNTKVKRGNVPDDIFCPYRDNPFPIYKGGYN